MAVKRATRRISVIGWLGVASVAGMLSGCALPPAVTIASLALDVASYVETGKTVMDHGISFVLRMDCGLLRVFDGPICTEWPDQVDVVVAGGSDGDSMSPPSDLTYLQVTAIRPSPRHAGPEADSRSARLDFAADWNGAAGAVETVPLVPAVPLGAVETVALVPAGDGGIAMLGFLADDVDPPRGVPFWRQLSRVGYLADDISVSTATTAAATVRG